MDPPADVSMGLASSGQRPRNYTLLLLLHQQNSQLTELFQVVKGPSTSSPSSDGMELFAVYILYKITTLTST